jgi:organic hydroperoxide reductase OsmC/OhrA
MKISARIANQQGKHNVVVETDGQEKQVAISTGGDGFGSSLNGGELLFLALATCYCNDLYREARKRGIEMVRVRVEVNGEFQGEGEGARNIRYNASVHAKAPQEMIVDLMRHTDAVAEIHKTLRNSTAVTLDQCEAREVGLIPSASTSATGSL